MANHWLIKTITSFFLLAVPAVMLLIAVWRTRSKPADDSGWRDLAFMATVLSVASYALWLGDLALCWWKPNTSWAVGFAVAWPLWGMFLTLLGCGLAFFANKEEKLKLLWANLLLFVLALFSIIAPN